MMAVVGHFYFGIPVAKIDINIEISNFFHEIPAQPHSLPPSNSRIPRVMKFKPNLQDD
jgi:hypothetical protein